MARSLNQISLIGRLGRDPEMRYTPTGKAVTSFSVATDHEWKGTNGEVQKETTWHNVETWGSLAEVCNQYLRKGNRIFVQGRQLHQSYEQNGVKKYFSKVNANLMVMLSGPNEGQEYQGEDEEESINFTVQEDIPF